jgi:hypothetical protein
MIVFFTVPGKALAYPIDSKLLDSSRSNVVEASKAEGIELK